MTYCAWQVLTGRRSYLAVIDYCPFSNVLLHQGRRETFFYA